MPGIFCSPTLKMRTSADSWQAEGASLESCCSASSAHDTARTEAQRLGLLAYLALKSSNVAWELGGVPAMLLSQPFSKEANVRRYLAARRG